jgi:PAS domain-containing protein
VSVDREENGQGPAAGKRREWTPTRSPHARNHQRKAPGAPGKLQPSTDLIERLEAEWPGLAAGPLAAQLRIWAQSDPALAGFATPQQVLRHLLSRSGAHPCKDDVLAALVREARVDPLAARLVLQALLPGLKAVAGRLLFEADERDAVWSALLAHCWERIRRYPLERRPTRIAANTLLDTLQKTTRELKRQRRHRDHLNDAPEGIADAPADRDVERVLGRAVEAAAISADEAELILRTRVDGVDLRVLAAEDGVAYNTLVVRRLRAERRLLVFLGRPAVTSRGRKAPFFSARALGAGLTGSAGRGAATDHTRRR